MDLQKTLNESSLVLVDFHAKWCMPCRMMSPIIDELAANYSGNLTVVKIDVDEEPELATAYDVQSVPTFIVFKDGETKVRFQGGMPKAKLEELIKPLL